MANDDIKKALDGINQIIFKICLTFIVSLLIISSAFTAVLIYKDYKAYDYDYEVPDSEIVNINGDSNKYGKDD